MPMSIKHTLAWTGYKFASTVLDDIWPQALFFTLVALMVCLVNHLTSTKLGMNSIMLSVLGTVVSLVVSFKTNNSYLRWWEGRNVWTNITSNSRQLAMLIWLQVPNRPKSKEDSRKEDKKVSDQDSKDKDEKREEKRLSSSSIGSNTHVERKWHKKDSLDPHDQSTEPLLLSTDTRSEDGACHLDSIPENDEKQAKKMEREKEQLKRETEELEGIIEKKTYIGLIQAFAVAMKHSLRGEKGPFYSDLYSLIAFLPKYNPSAYPPITRDQLLVLWTNGIPRQKWHNSDDCVAVPLTQPASFDGYAFEMLDKNEKPAEGPTDKESNPSGLTATSPAFKKQAVDAATKFVNSNDHDIVGFASVSQHDHRLCRDASPPRGNEKVTIASVELMPPRHPPAARIWDFFPPLRFIKVIIDWLKTAKRLEEQERAKGGKRRRGGASVKSEFPQEILMYLSSYINDLAERGDINSSFLGPLMTAIMELQKAISDLDKIATTPIPSAYSFHLRLTVWAYLFFLPFQLYQYIGWLTIPATAVASVTYLGFLEIGGQIEMPFGYEQSDLDLDKFVLKIAQQLAEVTAFPTNVPSRIIVQSHLNQPFLPSISLSVPELLGRPEPTAFPSSMGFAAAYPGIEDRDKERNKTEDFSDKIDMQPRPKTVRDLEIAMNANWREIGDETKKYLGRQRDQLENKTGMEVAVLTL